MIGFLKFLVLAPVAVVLVLLGVANRQSVTLVLDPVSPAASAFGMTLPLFVIIFAAILAGVIIGYVSAWFSQGVHRKSERQLKRECERLKSEREVLRAQAPATSTALLSRP